jgi:hypothetical protein
MVIVIINSMCEEDFKITEEFYKFYAKAPIFYYLTNDLMIPTKNLSELDTQFKKWNACA